MNTKTAMQELIERLKSLKSKGYDDAGIRTGIEIATQLLAKEKQDIIEFSEWLDTSDYVAEFWKHKRILLEPKMDGSHIEKIKEAREELYQYYFTQKYEQ